MMMESSQTSLPRLRRISNGMCVIYEDRDIIVVNKPSGLLTMGTEGERQRTAYFILTDYVRKGYSKSRNRIFIVHRLDRDTSGVLVFAKSEDAKCRLQDKWEETAKIYLAVVHGHMARKEDTITSYLAENRAKMMYSTDDPQKGKLARTAYKVLKETRNNSLLEINLLTGRKNQIRVHLADAGHPVLGDRKYGNHSDRERNLALHSRSLTINHPYSGERMTFEAELPVYFNRLIG